MNGREAGASDLKTIAYASRAVESMGSDELAVLEQQAQWNNRAAGITGLLVFDADAFIQVLEGPTDAVDATLARIRCDPRHEDLEQVLDIPIRERSFAHWALASIDLHAPAASADIFNLAEGLADFLARVDAAPPANGQILVDVFQRVLALLDKAQGDGQRGAEY